MLRYVVVSIVSGILFGILDGVINANPLAQRLFEVYKPVAKTSINPLAGMVIDLVYGFVTAGVFLLLYKSLPGGTGPVKGGELCVIGVVFPSCHVHCIAVGHVQHTRRGIALLSCHGIGRDAGTRRAVWADLETSGVSL